MTTAGQANLMQKRMVRFVEIRNSSSFNSNLQFSIDLTEAGLTLDDLGHATKLGEGHYIWNTRYGKLEEKFSKLTFTPA